MRERGGETVANKKKEIYPSKRHMNLYYKPDRTTKPATVSLYVLFVLVLLLGLAKLLVFDLYMDVRDKEEEYASVLREAEQYEEELKDYDEIHTRYVLYSKTDEEAAQVDRMEILDLIDATVRANAQVENVSITGNQAQVQLFGVTLGQTADIVSQIEESPIVASTSVNTAVTTQDGGDAASVNILILLQAKEEE